MRVGAVERVPVDEHAAGLELDSPEKHLRDVVDPGPDEPGHADDLASPNGEAGVADLAAGDVLEFKAICRARRARLSCGSDRRPRLRIRPAARSPLADDLLDELIAREIC